MSHKMYTGICIFTLVVILCFPVSAQSYIVNVDLVTLDIDINENGSATLNNKGVAYGPYSELSLMQDMMPLRIVATDNETVLAQYSIWDPRIVFADAWDENGTLIDIGPLPLSYPMNIQLRIPIIKDMRFVRLYDSKFKTGDLLISVDYLEELYQHCTENPDNPKCADRDSDNDGVKDTEDCEPIDKKSTEICDIMVYPNSKALGGNDTTKAIMVILHFENDELVLDQIDIKYGHARNYVLEGRDIGVNVISTNGSTLLGYLERDPRIGLSEDGTSYEPNAEFRLVYPFETYAGSLSIYNTTEGIFFVDLTKAIYDFCDSTNFSDPDCQKRDSDNDGVKDTEDCEPLEERAYKGAEEIDDGLDNDCNGMVDEYCVSDSECYPHTGPQVACGDDWCQSCTERADNCLEDCRHCTSDPDCSQSEYCRFSRGNASRNTCYRKLEENSSCRRDSECRSETCGSAGYCLPGVSYHSADETTTNGLADRDEGSFPYLLVVLVLAVVGATYIIYKYRR